MSLPHRRTGWLVLGLLLVAVPSPGSATELDNAEAAEALAIRTAALVVESFQSLGDSVWPGYDLAQRPLLLYVPDRWALLLNLPRPVEGFEPVPDSWSALKGRAQVHPGRYGDLVGQLVFDLQIEDIRTVAIPITTAIIPEQDPRPQSKFFAFAVHEAFHQHQRETFRTVETEPEERYPIEDPANGALAVLEMRLLIDLLKTEDRSMFLREARSFLTLRRHRWDRADPFVQAFESRIESIEGTAKYVEVRSIALLASLCPRQDRPDHWDPICAEINGTTPEAILLAEFQERLPGPALAPEDLPRHRVYPVAASLCLLLDRVGLPWKERVERMGRDSTLVDLLEEGLAACAGDAASSLEAVQQRHGYEAILQATRDSIETYLDAYRAVLARFEAQPGLRFQVRVPSAGVTRSRSSRARRWTMDRGASILSEHYAAYTLQARGPEEFSVEVRDRGLLDQKDEPRGLRTITFLAPPPDRVELDGEPAEWAGVDTLRFRELLLEGPGYRARALRPGSLSVADSSLTIDLSASPR